MRWMSYTVTLFLGSTLSIHASCIDLVRAYPTQLKGCSGNTLIWRDGTKMRYDDAKRNKSFNDLLNRPDLEDMFHFRYPKGAAGYGKAPAYNHDPGRIRYEPFFRKMYGNSPAQVRRHLKPVVWLPKSTKGRYRVLVSEVNGVNRKLEAVSRELDELISHHPEYKKYLVPLGGSFKWRKIAGTRRLSAHSFGAAIDINVKHSAYWRWNKGAYRYRNEIPLAIVEAFEKHGFIWGGKWYHYDTMHFEYRPELLRASGVKKRGSKVPQKSLKSSSKHNSSNRRSLQEEPDNLF